MCEEKKGTLIHDVNYRSFDALYKKNLYKQKYSHLTQSKKKTLRYGLKKSGISLGHIRILDIGFGTGEMLLSFPHSSEICGIEISDQSLDMVKEKAAQKKFKQFDFKKPLPDGTIPYADSMFGLVICSHLLEHVPDDRILFSEIKRLLSPGGTAAILIPLEHNADGVLPRHQVEIDDIETLVQEGRYHVRKYNDETFLDYLSRQNLEVIFHYVNEYIWDFFKIFFRQQYHRRIPIIGPMFSLFFNVTLIVMPHFLVRFIDKFFKIMGRRARQGLYIVKKGNGHV